MVPHAPASLLVRNGALSVRPADEVARFSLRLAPADTGQAAAAFGGPLPGRIGAMSQSNGRTALQLGPDEWHILAPPTDADALSAAFAALPVVHSLVDISHREVGLLVEGAAASLALRSAIAFDLETMAVGTGCRTLFDKAQILLIREAPARFRIEVWRSFADHVWSLLRAASREIDLDL